VTRQESSVLVTDLGLKTAISWDVFKHEFNRHFFP
jgi:hypothetical protein